MPSQKFIDSFLEKHNEYRALHKVKPLKYAADLQSSCQKWADKLAASKQLQHSVAGSTREKNTGENLFYIGSTDPTFKGPKGNAAVKSWYNEIKDYDFNCSENQIMENFQKIGHFSQVVWKGTKEVACAMAENSGIFVVVAQYRPAGNMVGSFKKNVFANDGQARDASSSSESSSSEDNDEFENQISQKLQNTKINSENCKKKSFTVSEFQFECLEEHNKHRKLHHAEELIMTPELNQSAQKWADHLIDQSALSNSNKSNETGESIYSYWTNDPKHKLKAAEVIDNWYKEIENYNFDHSEEQIRGNFQKIGNFSQIVWKNTQKLGIGAASKNGKTIVVAHYQPGGNVVGKFKRNVLEK